MKIYSKRKKREHTVSDMFPEIDQSPMILNSWNE